MPIYEYICQSCDRKYEVMQRITEEPLLVCQHCGGELKKMISNTSFVLKGTGWYATDYASDRKKSGDSGTKPEKTAEKKPDTVETGKKAEVKETASVK